MNDASITINNCSELFINVSSFSAAHHHLVKKDKNMIESLEKLTFCRRRKFTFSIYPLKHGIHDGDKFVSQNLCTE